MKADNVFDAVIGLMFSESSDKADYNNLFYPLLNIVLAECFEKNNILRRINGKAELTEIPFITNGDDEIIYEDVMTRAIIPHGIAANLYSEDDENGITNVYREKYIAMLNEIGIAAFRESEETL